MKKILARNITAQYDERAKSLLSNKSILAHILVKTVDEFRGMKPEEVISYIEGDPIIGEVPVEPGFTNTGTERSGKERLSAYESSAAKPVSLLREQDDIFPERTGL